jgi:hypothetical protein
MDKEICHNTAAKRQGHNNTSVPEKPGKNVEILI